MRAVIQRVSSAEVTIEQKVKGKIQHGLLVLLGIEDTDQASDIDWLCGKIARLRVFDDEGGVMNRSVSDVGGEVLVVSQFTLFASTGKGNRPSYSRAARPEIALPLYKQFLATMEAELGKPVHSGEFGAHMLVGLINEGPVTIIIDSRLRE